MVRPTRQSFDKMLEEYKADILRMGNLVEQALNNAVTSLAKQDVELAQLVVDGDHMIDAFMEIVEDHSLKLIATQQPMATDLRRIGTGFKIINDLERIGDHAVHIAEITLRFADQSLVKPLVDIPRMAEIAQEMLRLMLQAYVVGDLELAKQASEMDDAVDEIHARVFDELVEMMQKNPETVFQATHLLLVSRFLERVADHVTNVGERLVYQNTGVHQDLNV